MKRISDDKVNEIITRRNNGETVDKITETVGVSRSTVCTIIRMGKVNNLVRPYDKNKLNNVINYEPQTKYIEIINDGTVYDRSLNRNEIVHLHITGMNPDSIAEKVGCDRKAVDRVLELFQIGKDIIFRKRAGRPLRINKQEYDKIIDMHINGTTITEIAKISKCYDKSISKIVNAYDSYIREGNWKNPYHTTIKSVIDDKELVELRDAGFTATEIADYFDCNVTLVQKHLSDMVRLGKLNPNIIQRASDTKDVVLNNSNRPKTTLPSISNDSVNKTKQLPEVVEKCEMVVIKYGNQTIELHSIGTDCCEFIENLLKLKDDSITMKELSDMTDILSKSEISVYDAIRR